MGGPPGAVEPADAPLPLTRRRWTSPVPGWALGLSFVLHLVLFFSRTLWSGLAFDHVIGAQWDEQDEPAVGMGLAGGRLAELLQEHEKIALHPALTAAVTQQPKPAAEPEPEPAAKPEPAPEPEPEPAAKPEPEPAPAAKPEPEPAAKPAPPPMPDPLVLPGATPPAPVEPAVPAPPPPVEPVAPPAEPVAASESEEVGPPAPVVPPLPGLDRAGPSNLPLLQNYAPGNARLTALIRVDRLRGSSFEPGLRQILQALPDYRILLQQTDLDPFAAFDSMFISSAAPRYIQETMLAVRHRLTDEELKAALGRRFAAQPDWGQYGGYPTRPLVPEGSGYRDRRQIVLGRPGLALVVRPEWLEWLTAPLPPGSPLLDTPGAGVGAPSPGAAPPAGEGAGSGLVATPALGPAAAPLTVTGSDPAATDGYGPPQPVTPLDALTVVDGAAEDGNTLLLLSARGLIFFAPGVGRLPRFEAVRLKVTDVDSPTLTIDLLFADAARATGFAASCPMLARKIARGIPLGEVLGVDELLGRLDCVPADRWVTVSGRYTRSEVQDMLIFVLPFVPHPPLDGLPPPPPPASSLGPVKSRPPARSAAAPATPAPLTPPPPQAPAGPSAAPAAAPGNGAAPPAPSAAR